MFEDALAELLGYVVGLGSFFLFTPIAVRLVLQKSADGLTMTTWWFHLCSYTFADIYAYRHDYPLSTYVESLICTVQVATILFLTAHYQRLLHKDAFRIRFLAYLITSYVLLFHGPKDVIALGQLAVAIFTSSALIPQFLLNHKRQSAGDYSPITAGLAVVGCAIRLFTTAKLADSDALLLFSFGTGLTLNVLLITQIVYLGVRVEGKSLRDVLIADLSSGDGSGRDDDDDDGDGNIEDDGDGNIGDNDGDSGSDVLMTASSGTPGHHPAVDLAASIAESVIATNIRQSNRILFGDDGHDRIDVERGRTAGIRQRSRNDGEEDAAAAAAVDDLSMPLLDSSSN
mmetsp:Transcript_20364/g.57850  ORF Transcript_20364/g.57850 Transcript_20364/m.57850 type:complete len:343 (-) Transcript_20364:741-1769(-)